jgi:hypothetical protein
MSVLLKFNYFCIMSIPILFVNSDSIYKLLPGTDCYDLFRDARTFRGSSAVVAHPPCRLFSRLRAFSTAPASERELAYFALSVVQQNGGVLEHPASSSLWKEKKLPLGSQIDAFGGFTISVNQHWFGHPAQKNTWLYIVGITPNLLPSYTLNFDAVRYSLSSSNVKSGKLELKKRLRNHTPAAFAAWLLQIAHLVNLNK